MVCVDFSPHAGEYSYGVRAGCLGCQNTNQEEKFNYTSNCLKSFGSGSHIGMATYDFVNKNSGPAHFELKHIIHNVVWVEKTS